MRTLRLAALAMLLLASRTPAQEAPQIQSVQDVYERLQQGPLSGASADAVTGFVEKKFKKADLSQGGPTHLLQKFDGGGGFALFCLRAPEDSKVAVSGSRGRRWPMTRVGDSDLWIHVEKFPNFSQIDYRYEVDGRELGSGRPPRLSFEHFELSPDSLEQSGVPRGELIEMGNLVSKVYYPGSSRPWWIYVPAQYDPAHAAATKLIVFNDGQGFAKGNGNACTVLDNLIHKKQIPVMIAVFVQPGSLPSQRDGGKPQSIRGDEYDTCTPRYATFLDEELLPIVREKYPHSPDPWDHAICGSSSGGSCAFTAAWYRNDLFRRVISFVGSFCDFRPIGDFPQYGGENSLPLDAFSRWKVAHNYPGLIRKTNPPKPLKVFLQDGENDLDNSHGSWPLANRQMDAALTYAGYDHQLVMGKGVHSSQHGKALLPEILIWIWSDQTAPQSTAP